jgi:hypothetical protein
VNHLHAKKVKTQKGETSTKTKSGADNAAATVPAILAKPSRRGPFLAVLGLVLTAIGLVTLIQLFPRLSAIASSPTDKNDQLGSSKFTVSNDGYLEVTDVMSACFLWKLTFVEGPRTGDFSNKLSAIVVPPESALNPTEGYTVPCIPRRLIDLPAPFHQPVLARADLAIVVYYRAWPFKFYRDHRLFRFLSRIQNDGTVIWEKQPAAVLEPDYDRYIAAHGGTFPPTFP